jgi:DNA-directed RNA polymerase subunit F
LFYTQSYFMKKLFLLITVLSAGFFAMTQPPAGKAKVGNTYGEAIKADGAIAISQLPGKLVNEEPLNTKIKAKVTDVCPKKGCWVSLEMPDSTKVFVKMKDYGFFVPVDMIGKTVVLDGEAILKTASVAELQHYAEDAKKSKEEIAAITKPQKEIRFTAKGILVVE